MVAFVVNASRIVTTPHVSMIRAIQRGAPYLCSSTLLGISKIR